MKEVMSQSIVAARVSTQFKIFMILSLVS